jgi:hypothetical protein
VEISGKNFHLDPEIAFNGPGEFLKSSGIPGYHDQIVPGSSELSGVLRSESTTSASD